MRVELTPLKDRILKVLVEATPEETENVRRTAAQKLGKRVRVPGFRPGKAPYPILLKHLDPLLLQEETIEVFLDKYYPEILEKEKIEPSGQGKLMSILSIEPLKLELHIPLEPLVELGDYHLIRIPYEPPVIQEEVVNKAIDQLRQQNALLEPVERPIEEDDVVYIDLFGYQKENDGVTDQIVVEQEDIPIQVLGEQQNTGEFPFDGFSRLLIGKKANDQFTVDFHYSEDAPSPNLYGKDINFQVTIKNIKKRILPELNDEFAQSIGEFGSLEELKKSIRESLEKEALTNYHEEYDNKALEEVIKISRIEYPLEYKDKERKAYLESLERALSRMNLDLDLYIKMRGEENFEKEVEEAVEHRLKSSLTLMELAKKENIKIDLVKVQENTQRIMQGVLERDQEARVPMKTLENFASRVATSHMIDQIYEKTYQRLRIIAKGEAVDENISLSQENQTDTQPSSEVILEESSEKVQSITPPVTPGETDPQSLKESSASNEE